jgi:hypothetical protein
MNINFKRYLYMFSIVLIINLLFLLYNIFFSLQYSGGGFKKFFDKDFGKELPFIFIKPSVIF